MSWLKARIDVDAALVESLETVLLAFGAVAIELADAADQQILEPPPGATPLWDRVRVAALFESTTSETDIRLAIATVVEPGALTPIRFDIVEQEDWVGKLRDELEPLCFGDNLWICPPGKTCPDPDGIVIAMEPGLAFGTGTHPSTSLCLDWLARNPPTGHAVLDFGCGSGVLGVACLALGAAAVTAVDIDEQALTATRDNAARNGVGDRMTVTAPNALAGTDTFDVVVANILSGTLIELEPTLRRHCSTGTALALSGILTEQAAAVADGYRHWASLAAVTKRDGWALLTGTTN
ncbi:MAG: 50S ribosomal protein L11 methyltransferase [Gammaproteobacteria bacterium]